MATRIDDNAEEEYEISIREVALAEENFASVDTFKAELETVKEMFKSDRNMSRRIDTRIKKRDEKVTKAATAGSKQIVATENAYSLFDVVEPPYNLATLARLYEASSPNYAAINAKVANLIGLGYDYELSPSLKLMLEDGANDEARMKKMKKIAKAKIAMTEWLDGVSDDGSFTAVMHKVVTDLEATGCGYLEIARTVRGDIGYIGHIPSHTMRVRRAKDGFVQMSDGKAIFFARFGQKGAKSFNQGRANEIIQFKKFTPTNSYYGIADVVSAKESAYGLIAANSFNLDYFNNKAVPRYVVSVEGAKIDPKSERVLLEFLRGLKGNHQRTIIVPLPPNPQTGVVPKLNFERVEAEIQEGSFSKYKLQSRDDVLMAHRTPASKVGASDTAALAAAKDLDKTFKEQVIRPQQELLESKVNWIIKEKTDIFVLRFNEFTLTDEDTQSQIDERDLRMGALVPNERRAKIGLPPREHGNEPVVLSAQQQADQAATARQSRTRDANRSSTAPDTQGEARNPKGEGRSTP